MVWNECCATKLMVDKMERRELRRLEFRAEDGVSNVINLATADSSTIVLCLPAMGVPARKYEALIQGFAQSGVNAACFDLRGNGDSSVRASRNSDFGYKELIEYDLPAAIDILKQALPSKKIVLLGHSLGGQVSLLYLRRNVQDISGLVLAASCSVYYKGWAIPGNLATLLFSQTSRLIVHMVGYFPGRKIGFGGTEAKTIMIDWANNALTGDYRLKGSIIDYKSQPESTQLPVLAVNFSEDNLAPPKATDYLLSKLNSTAVERRMITANQLGLERADHFNWLSQPQSLIEQINDWLKTTNIAKSE